MEPEWIKKLAASCDEANRTKDDMCVADAARFIDRIDKQLQDERSKLAKSMRYAAGKGDGEHAINLSKSESDRCVCRYRDQVCYSLKSTYPSLRFAIKDDQFKIGWADLPA